MRCIALTKKKTRCERKTDSSVTCYDHRNMRYGIVKNIFDIEIGKILNKKICEYNKWTIHNEDCKVDDCIVVCKYNCDYHEFEKCTDDLCKECNECLYYRDIYGCITRCYYCDMDMHEDCNTIILENIPDTFQRYNIFEKIEELYYNFNNCCSECYMEIESEITNILQKYERIEIYISNIVPVTYENQMDDTVKDKYINFLLSEGEYEDDDMFLVISEIKNEFLSSKILFEIIDSIGYYDDSYLLVYLHLNDRVYYNHLDIRDYTKMKILRYIPGYPKEWFITVRKELAAKIIQEKMLDWLYKPYCKDGSIGLMVARGMRECGIEVE